MLPTHEELKAMLEAGDAHLKCGLCEAIFWVDATDRNDDGDPRLYRMGHVRIDDCEACSEFATKCNMKNEFSARVDL